MFRFLHAADLHLDSPLQGLERYQDAPVEAVRGAPRRALSALVDLAIAERVAFVLLAGDLYDGDWRDYNTGLFFASQMRRLADAGIRVFLVAGNHDAASQITKRLSLPPNVHRFSTARPETIELPDWGVAIHGQGFPDRSVSSDLSAAYPTSDPGRFEIGLLHTSLDGRPGHAAYAPCTVEGLRRKGYAYWALGHVHKREEIRPREEGEPWIVFPGNLQGRHARETGAKGASMVTVEHGRVARVVHCTLDAVRWTRVEVDLGGADRIDDVLARVRLGVERAIDDAGGRLLAARVVLSGATSIHDQLVRDPDRWESETRSTASDVATGAVWVERLVVETHAPRDLRALLGREDAVGGLLQRILRLEGAQLDLASLGSEFDDLKSKLASVALPVGEGADAEAGEAVRLDPTDPRWLSARLPAVRDLLWSRLVGEPLEES